MDIFHFIFNAVQSLELVLNQESLNLKIPTSILDSLHPNRSHSGTFFFLVDVQVSVQADSADQRLTVIVDHRFLSHSVDSCCVCVHIFMSEIEELFNSVYLYSPIFTYICLYQITEDETLQAKRFFQFWVFVVLIFIPVEKNQPKYWEVFL